MDKYNQSHNKDLTPYKALRNIDKGIRKAALGLCRFLQNAAKLAGFQFVSAIRIRHTATGSELSIKPDKDKSKPKDRRKKK